MGIFEEENVESTDSSNDEATKSSSKPGGSFNKDYERIPPDQFARKHSSDVPKTYLISGWHKPDNDTAVKMLRQAVNAFNEASFTMRVPAGDLTDIIHEETITADTPVEIYKPWPKYEPKKELSTGATFYDNMPEKAYNYAAAFDADFNTYKQARKSFIASTIWALYGEDLITPVRCLVLYTWGREKSPGDINTETNKNIAVLIKAAAHYEIPIYNLNDKKSRESFSDFLENS